MVVVPLCVLCSGVRKAIELMPHTPPSIEMDQTIVWVL